VPKSVGPTPFSKPPIPPIPDHALIAKIGQGSYGEVWLARNILGTLRAVKIVWRSTFDSDRPFDREFRGIQKFEPVSRKDDGLVDVLQIGRNEELGCFYYVMELADNAAAESEAYTPRTLRSEILRRNRMPFEDCIRFMLSICGGLATLHRHGLIHRDITPSNIIIVGGVAKLADIGLVTEATERRTFVGTEGFIAPEGPGSPLADIYSLGMVLYEAATGNDRLSFPSLPVGPASGQIDDSLLEINSVLLRACAINPKDRYPTADELRADIQLLQGGRSVKRLRLLEKRLLFARRAGAAAAAFALLAGAGFLAVGWREKVARENNERLERALNRATAAEHSAKERLYQALTATGAAERRSGAFGQRFASLADIVAASELHPGAQELRDAAITSLALPDLREIGRIPKPPDVSCQCFIADFTRIASVDTNRMLRVHSTGNKDFGPAVRLKSAPYRIFPADGAGRYVCTLSSGGPPEVCNTANPADLRALPNWRTAFVSDGAPRLVGTSESGDVLIQGLNESGPSTVSAGLPMDLLSRPRARLAAVASSRTNIIVLIDLDARRIARVFTLPSMDPLSSLDLSVDESFLAVGSRAGRISIFDLHDTTRPRASMQIHSTVLTCAALHPDGDWCVTSGWDSATKLFGVVEGAVIAERRSESTAGIFNERGDRFWNLEALSGDLVLFDAAGRGVCRVLGEPVSSGITLPGPWNASFSTDGQLLATGTAGGVRLYDAVYGREVGMLSGPNAYAAAFDLDSSLYAAGPSALIRFPVRRENSFVFIGARETLNTNFWWHLHGGAAGVLATGDTTTMFFRPGEAPIRLARSTESRGSFVSPDGRWMASDVDSATIVVQDAGTGAVVRRIPCKKAIGYGFNPEGTALAVGDLDEVFAVSLETGRRIWTTKAFGAPGPTVWSPDGRTVASVRDVMIPHLFDAVSGRLLARLEHPEPVPYNSVAFSPDSGRLACASTAHRIHLWDLRRLRTELVALKLDWDAPSMESATARGPRPQLELGSPPSTVAAP
jgi:WD40 repeat protein